MAHSRLVVEVYGCTNPGLVREANEDRFAVGDLDRRELLEMGEERRVEVERRGPLIIVCDGMGGVQGGGVASAIAAEVVWKEMCGAPPTDEPPVYARLLRRAIRTANLRVREEGRKDPSLHGMGTTVSAAGLAGDLLIVAQVGDSRAYVQRGSRLTQVTRDQSVVSALVQAGRMTEDEAAASIQKGVILQALGTADDVEVAMSIVELREGDRVLLSSDGLHGPVGDEGMGELLAGEEELEAGVQRLVEAAREAGGPDNITAVLTRIRGSDLRAPLGDDDVPRFTEFDPSEEGERALTDTSWVARRLAKRAGLRSDTLPPSIPATGQHPIVPEVAESEPEGGPERAGPAEAALEEGQRLGVVAWILGALAVLVVAALLVWDWL